MLPDDESPSVRPQKNVDQLRLSELEVFHNLSTKYTSKAHAYGVSIFALLLVENEKWKFQVQDIAKTLFLICRVNVYSDF